MKAVTKTNQKASAKHSEEAGPSEQQLQLETFNRAMEAFHQRDFKKAKDLFETAANGPAREVAFSAKTHARMCEQRLAKDAMKFDSPEDYYAYATALANRQQYREAIPLLLKALQLREADHYHYALALCLGQSGDLDGAMRHLSRAIEIAPRNRGLASTDPDWAELIRQPKIRELLLAEK